MNLSTALLVRVLLQFLFLAVVKVNVIICKLLTATYVSGSITVLCYGDVCIKSGSSEHGPGPRLAGADAQLAGR